MKRPIIQSEGYFKKCAVCDKPNKPHTNYCSKLHARKMMFMFFEKGKMKFSKTDEQIKKLLK